VVGVFLCHRFSSLHPRHAPLSLYIFLSPFLRVPLFHAIGDTSTHGTKNDPQLSKKTQKKIREKKWSGFKLIFSTLVGQMVDFLIKKKQLLDINY
jgi:hypothetical protein